MTVIFHILNVNAKEISCQRYRCLTQWFVSYVMSSLEIFALLGCYAGYNVVTDVSSGFGGLEMACWPLVPKFAGSNPAEALGFFRAKKILSTPSFGREVKLFVPCRTFTACKRSLNVTWKSGIFRQNSSTISRPSSSSSHYWGLWWRHLAVQVGTTKDQGLQCIRGR